MRREKGTIGRSPHRVGLLTVEMTEPSAHGWPESGQPAGPLPPVDDFYDIKEER
jgi:hypothetical protein